MAGCMCPGVRTMLFSVVLTGMYALLMNVITHSIYSRRRFQRCSSGSKFMLLY